MSSMCLQLAIMGHQHQLVNMGDADVEPLDGPNESADVRWALYLDCAEQVRVCLLKANSLGLFRQAKGS